MKKKPILNTYSPKFMILNVDFALKLSNYSLWKRFICLTRILKMLFTTLYTQFNHHTLPVTPFNLKQFIKKPSNICISYLKSDMMTFMHYLPKVCGSNLWNSIFSIFLWDNVTKFFLKIDKRFKKINIQKGTYTCKVVISICLFVYLFVCMSNHHLSTPWPSGLKFHFDFLLGL